MKYAREFVTSTLVGGLLIVVPVYLAVLLLLKVFVPSVPTPLDVLSPERVHILDIPFTQAIRSISRWGSGSRDLVAAMRKG